MSLHPSAFVDTGCRVATPPLWFSLLAPLIIWHHRHCTRRQLRELDSRQLEDVGIDPSARRTEIAKWFWQP
jgi:uncharacterized protein YjiS (DUF1127 family)